MEWHVIIKCFHNFKHTQFDTFLVTIIQSPLSSIPLANICIYSNFSRSYEKIFVPPSLTRSWDSNTWVFASPENSARNGCTDINLRLKILGINNFLTPKLGDKSQSSMKKQINWFKVHTKIRSWECHQARFWN
jgi:hypothetical protein